MTGTIKPESNTGRLRAFFEANPEEELTYQDIEDKFGMTPSAARQSVKQLRDRRELETLHVIRATPAKKASVAT